MISEAVLDHTDAAAEPAAPDPGHGTDAPVESAMNATPAEDSDQLGAAAELPETPAESVAGEQPTASEQPTDTVIPIPAAPPVGAIAGAPVLVGGADLQDSTATLISYQAADGGEPREVLLATVTEDAEAKLLDAVSLSTKMVPVQVEEEVAGRLPIDEEKGLYEACAKAAKSINHKLKNGLEIPYQTKAYLEDAQQAVQAVLDEPASTPQEVAMATTYQAWLTQMQARVDAPDALAYSEGGKVPKIEPYEQTGTHLVTKMIPAPTEGAENGKLVATLTDASRIKAKIDPYAGVTTWDGVSRSSANGKQYEIDLGEGYTAIYRPYGANDPSQHEFSIRGQLEIHAPLGSGHGQDLVSRMGALHLVNRGMTQREAEWTYLANNIEAQGLDKKPGVAQALAKAQQLEDLRLQELFYEKAHEAVGKDANGLASIAKEWQLEAAASSLPAKVRMVREAVAKTVGFDSGQALANSPGYDPVPQEAGGWLSWKRFDVGNKSAELSAAWQGKSLAHSVSGHNLVDMISTGLLASTERRAVMGIGTGLGKSEASDKTTGGATSVFLRVRPTSHVDDGQTRLVWDDPLKIIDNTSVYAYPEDHYGALNPAAQHHSTSKMTRDPMKIAKFSGGSNEVMIRHGLDLLGAHAPSRILCSANSRKVLLNIFSSKGITHLGGKPVEDVVIVKA
ncbi:hypothetical protein MRI28_17140 [Nocardiopsis dassonvillei]|uniref:hypothetical protein n=1 Tax=Nocardiopsis dassonvillei TaxID=2014 RepID=UPI00200E36CC|nr:hypothetical protein [Nocardiopsis dassonvillei]MCK9871341.1 hypothetical protein [Nocardiopsis dassonvillei]